jgi:hypothetical protein
MDEPKTPTEKKPFLKSKTNWVQILALLAAGGATFSPEFQRAICEDGRMMIALQAFITLIARNIWSDIAVKPQKKSE